MGTNEDEQSARLAGLEAANKYYQVGEGQCRLSRASSVLTNFSLMRNQASAALIVGKAAIIPRLIDFNPS